MDPRVMKARAVQEIKYSQSIIAFTILMVEVMNGFVVLKDIKENHLPALLPGYINCPS
jgi:hypothetical protein